MCEDEMDGMRLKWDAGYVRFRVWNRTGFDGVAWDNNGWDEIEQFGKSRPEECLLIVERDGIICVRHGTGQEF